MANFEQMLADPAKTFATPEQVLASADLTDEQRCWILEQWSYDLRELLVASDENMAADDRSEANAGLLARVEDALRQLGGQHQPHPAPTRQGGV